MFIVIPLVKTRHIDLFHYSSYDVLRLLKYHKSISSLTRQLHQTMPSNRDSFWRLVTLIWYCVCANDNRRLDPSFPTLPWMAWAPRKWFILKFFYNDAYPIASWSIMSFRACYTQQKINDGEQPHVQNATSPSFCVSSILVSGIPHGTWLEKHNRHYKCISRHLLVDCPRGMSSGALWYTGWVYSDDVRIDQEDYQTHGHAGMAAFLRRWSTGSGGVGCEFRLWAEFSYPSTVPCLLTQFFRSIVRKA